MVLIKTWRLLTNGLIVVAPNAREMRRSLELLRGGSMF